MWDTAWQNLRISVRGLLRGPGVSVAIIVTLALGIGANAMMFGVIDRLLLSPPQHLAQAERLRHLYLERGGADDLRRTSRILTYPDLEDLQKLPAFASVGGYTAGVGLWTMGTGAEARRVRVQQAAAALFPTLGVTPARGRFYSSDEDAPGAPLMAVLGEEFWEREFGRDPAIVGRVLQLNRGRYEIVGIAPAGFTGAELSAVDVWLPLRASAFAESGGDAGFDDRGMGWISAVVRLNPGVTDTMADAQLTAAYIAARRAFEQEVGAAYMDRRSLPRVDREAPRLFTASVIAARGPSRSRVSSIAIWLAGVSLVVLLIACANVANLLLARGIRARREIAIRAALGAGRRRLVMQLLTDAGVLAGAGALAALAVAWWSSRVVHAIVVPDVAFTDTGMPLRLLWFVSAAAVLTTLLAGLLPALQASRTAGGGDVLRAASRGNSSSRSDLRGALMIGQITLSVVLLVGAGLFVRSLWRAVATDVGFDYRQTLSVTIEDNADLGGDRTARRQRRAQLFRDALERVSILPGVRAAALSGATTPLAGMGLDNAGGSELRIPGFDAIPQLPGGGPYKYSGTERFFETLGLKVTRGRAFVPGEFKAGAEPVAMVNDTFARTIWPGRDPLAQCIIYADPDRKGQPAPCRRIVGVFEDIARSGLSEPPAMQVSFPLLPDATLIKAMVIRTEGDPAPLIPSIRRAIASVSPAVRFAEIRPGASRFDSLLGPWRLGAMMFGAFGLLALVVAAVGLFSLLAFGVAQRQRELGIRAALGANRRHLIQLVMGQAARLVFGGLALGVGIALAVGRTMDGLLFGVTPTDLPVYGGVVLALILSGVLAGLVPAWRATSVNPARAFEAE
jgi:predicted permease